MPQREKGDGFYDRLKKQQKELDDKSISTLDAYIELTKAFAAAAAPQQKELQEKVDAAWEENRAVEKQIRALRELERNPPWGELQKQLLYANYAKVEELTRDGTLIKLANEELVPLLGQPAYAGDEKIADLLIARGANVKLPGHDNLTPLLLSVMKDNAGIFKKLLKAGADITDRTTQGDGVKELAEYNDATEVQKVLKTLDKKTKPAAKKANPKKQRTP